MKRSIKRGVVISSLLVLMMNLTACGYFLYPERKGQQGGRVDPVVVILDAAGLLFGVLPGVVAFAVDFTNGTIYLPPGGSSAIDRHLSHLDDGEVREVIDQNGQVWLEIPLDSLAGEGEGLQRLGEALSTATGRHVVMNDIVWLENLAALRTAMTEQMAAR
ncbi:hypothetical protein [Microbulbifer thermotolerans]|uniref:Uncharacterized protein n=1 Tax=Microbulbifer thermotolerans TaxID=252514 RepID=A0A143HM51_MICTH|nr:hypothetical protein [Microbulbifer thermotolerans]AMX02763.1 hypothetical protein A3224_09355 [Microbulbifer thermotolerans]MCX2779621.1 hypothetical protein [Microbulbifer thermotolerans]MCX2782587.1 hypothetical protein [Microbulbifer thermotolerans]MCX2794599.1 hypothetical protein [Microbulbifer thermotolerans]MCX2801427.1 hypothetical protein [Microbulbifer thermotolerans]